MNDRKLTTGFYRPTESYKSIPEHIAVCFEDDLTLVAVIGASDDDTDHVLESHQYAQLFAAAPETLQKLSHALARIAELTTANESMQEDAVQNTYAFGQMLHANKEQAEEIRTLKQALTDIRATTVTLGDSQSAWKAWRKCSDIAGEALK